MKSLKIFIYISCLLVAFTGCKVGRTTETSGYENESFITFTTNAEKPRTVQVIVDNDLRFDAEVKKVSVHNVKGKIFAIKSGRHLLEVKEGNKVVYKKEIFLSAQETKTIQIP
ncbi:MAG: hypothetical protein RR202_04525 [Bacteroidales bacterium]